MGEMDGTEYSKGVFSCHLHKPKRRKGFLRVNGIEHPRFQQRRDFLVVRHNAILLLVPFTCTDFSITIIFTLVYHNYLCYCLVLLNENGRIYR